MRWRCTCAYDGSNYAGWQIQGKGQLAVQEAIEQALKAILKCKVSIHGSGRTDAGVHALEQVFHFDYEWSHGGESLRKALNAKLPRDIRIESSASVEEDFHARFSAVSKRYHYRLCLGEADPFNWRYCWPVSPRLDLNKIVAAMALLEGEHDFAAFAANRGIEYESTVRRLLSARLRQDQDFVYLIFEANGFMYKMVRSLVGLMVNIGLGRAEADEVSRRLAEGTRTPMVQVAPAEGLFLEKVFYS